MHLNFLILSVIVCLFSAPTFALFEDIETCDEVYSLDLAGFLYQREIFKAYEEAIAPIAKQKSSAFLLGGLSNGGRGGMAGSAAASQSYQARIYFLIQNRDNELEQLRYRLEQLHYHNQHCFE